MYVVTVEFVLQPGSREAFLPLMLANASQSIKDEPDCLQFDVCRDPANGNRIFLYEVYSDRAGFDTHLASAHFRSFDASVADMIATKTVATFERVK
jgi:quinol monooxygenase YgiN